VALALDATIAALSPRGQRTIPAARFFTGIWSTALEPDEVLTGVTFPAAGPRQGFAIEEFAQRPGDFAVAGAAVAVELGDDGTAISRCRIGLFGLGPTPLRAVPAETVAVGASARSPLVAAEIGRTAVAELESVPSDLHGGAAYRKRVGAAVVAAAVSRAIEEAVHG
jgi:carbon-monoxide dehydrogenase medium subunit